MISCRKDEIIDTAEIDLSFSLDTLRFDTVFTELGTITRFLKVYNNEVDAVIIDRLKIATGDQSFFRMNVDGYIGNEITDVRVEGQDSIYIFVEATIDPDQPLSNSPFIVEDQINVTANQSDYIVQLEAFGQNANYIPNRFSAGSITPAGCNGTIIWDDPKPYVIYGVLAIDQCDLIIEAGTRVYVHGGIAINENGIYNDGLIVFTPSASLTVNGTAQDPVYFLSDRLEEEFLEVQGQWGGIIFQADSQINTINHAVIRNSIVGISVDSAAVLEINNSEISFTSGTGLLGSHAFISATNCLFHNNELNGISLGYGGNYRFQHCTVASYDNQASAVSANNIRCTDPLCQGLILTNQLKADFENCIFVGNEEDEVSLLDFFAGTEPTQFDVGFDHNIIVVEELLDEDAFPDFLDDCNNCLRINRNDTLFLDLMENDYHLDTLSMAIDIGQYIGIDFDIENNPRETDAVDIGCYEYQK